VEVENISSPITFGSRGQTSHAWRRQSRLLASRLLLSLSMRRNHVWKPINNETHKKNIANKRERSPPIPQPLSAPCFGTISNAIINNKARKNPI